MPFAVDYDGRRAYESPAFGAFALFVPQIDE